MSDISITITSDPTQAVQGIRKVQKAGDELVVTSKKVSQAAAMDASQSVQSVLTVSRSAQQAIGQTGAAVGAVGAGIKQAANDAAKVTGAFGQAVPVVGKLGSAIAAAITGPVGAVSAAIGLAIAGIQKMIAEAESRIQRLRASASAQSSSAYDAVLQGRQDYAAQLQVLAQVKEIDRIAQSSALTAKQLASFRQLASQVGISERDVGSRGIRSGSIAEAERTLKQQRSFYAEQEYQAYLEAIGTQLRAAVQDSALSSAAKKSLASKSVQEMADIIASRARSGDGWTLDEFKAYQDLYSIAKPLREVTESYRRDAMLGRSQADLNAAAVSSITGAHAKSASGAADNSAGGAASPGTLAYLEQQHRAEVQAAEQERREQERRTEAAARLTQGLERQIEFQQLVNAGKEREAYILRNRLGLEDALGRQLSEAETSDTARLAGMLYDLQHPAAPELSPEPGAADAVRTQARSRAASAAANLDRLQRIGANVARAAATPEKLVLDKQLSVQESIKSILQSAVLTHPDTSIMRF